MLSSFWLLCLGTLIAGMYNACGQYYRFAAADAVPAVLKARAISWVLAGGIIGGVLGPESSKLTRELLAPQFLATYFTLGGFALLALILVRHIELPAPSAEERHGAGRPLREIASRPAFLAAVTAAVVGYAVMNLLMTATPLAMDLCRHPFADAALVLEWHVIAMFAPAFFTGSLIARWGAPAILLAGAALQAVCAAIALSGVSLMHFWWALVLLGVGWNFLYIGGTTLLTETYTPAEKAKVQGANDFSVFAAQALSSLMAGALLTGGGWDALNVAVLPLIALSIGATLWLLRSRRRASTPV